jgi:hypothetical protein
MNRGAEAAAAGPTLCESPLDIYAAQRWQTIIDLHGGRKTSIDIDEVARVGRVGIQPKGLGAHAADATARRIADEPPCIPSR